MRVAKQEAERPPFAFSLGRGVVEVTPEAQEEGLARTELIPKVHVLASRAPDREIQVGWRLWFGRWSLAFIGALRWWRVSHAGRRSVKGELQPIMPMPTVPESESDVVRVVRRTGAWFPPGRRG